MLADLRDAMRQLRKAPGFTTTALITLALGIGATTAIFTLVHQVMLKSLPVTNPSELWKIGDKDRCCNWGGYTQGDDADFALFSGEAYQNFRAHTPELVDLAALHQPCDICLRDNRVELRRHPFIPAAQLELRQVPQISRQQLPYFRPDRIGGILPLLESAYGNNASGVDGVVGNVELGRDPLVVPARDESRVVIGHDSRGLARKQVERVVRIAAPLP